ncbi:RagB/SusD family nutrient uptake outer membrane protein [Flavobacterium tructae]|uniref:Carbohydrate-binding protein SusD n=1 Tax=Flavobacterium tructae TaxID=1114873 RepID=A0A1S1J9L1_9FLAO|nr:RagB/SusD family nutrient uptake outer membrane protein [Flavobacterium tructae]OHT47377.1 carbohydrate-binding protein SusD [Flavobacterium tructae]OXB19658.1 RagB/SusD family nutrient uptake outer membrane protein [Flavobacterium tructae]
MKNIIKSILLTVAVLGLNSCSEDKILDLVPVNNVPTDVAFSTPTYIETYMNGVYNAAAIGTYNSGTSNGGRGYVWGAAFVEQGECMGEDVVNNATFYQLTYTQTYDPTSANNVYYWVDGYRLINRCNLMIEGTTEAVAKGIITKAVGDDYIGQAKFLRAITHFELLNYFARPYHFTAGGTHPGVPYREVGVNTQAEIDSENAKPRNTVAQCYDKVIADLNDAESLIVSNGFNNGLRVVAKATKSAAIAFKTRVYLQKRDWANVITEGVKLNGLYTLTAKPNDVFVPASNLSNTESIFSIQHSATANPGVNAGLASILNARALVNISPIIWRNTKWLADDKRREEGVMIKTVAGRKYTNKYSDVTNLTDAAPVIRYAEVVLNMAEAQARLSNTTVALNLLNSVRNRALANPVATPANPVGQAYTAASFATPADLVAGILVERRIEFLVEGRRWSDIHRLQGDPILSVAINGIPAKLANAAPAAALYTLGTPYPGPYGVPALPYTDYKFIWPIPQIEMNTNPGLGQNPDW